MFEVLKMMFLSYSLNRCLYWSRVILFVFRYLLLLNKTQKKGNPKIARYCFYILAKKALSFFVINHVITGIAQHNKNHTADKTCQHFRVK